MIDRSLRVACHLVRRAHQVHDALFADHIAGIDLTSPQFVALSAIGRGPQIEFMQLAETIGYDSATLYGVVNRLLAKRLITRKVGKRDRRTRQLALTQQGRAVLALAMPQARAVEESLLAALAPDERETLISLLERVVTYEHDRNGVQPHDTRMAQIA